MLKTRETLERIRDLLREDPPASQKALRLVKDLMIQGVCMREQDALRTASITLLEKLVRPVLAGDQERQARVGRLSRQIRTDRIFHDDGIAAHLETIQPWLTGLKVRVHAPDVAPPFPAKLLRETLWILGGSELRTVFPPDKEPTWEQIHLQLGTLIHRERRSRGSWQREREELREFLAETARVLAESLRLVGADSQDIDLLVGRLAHGGATLDFMAIRDVLLAAVQRFRARAQDLRGRLRESREAEGQFRVLLRRAEWELLDVRDEKLVDSITGLPNRFALLAYVERAMQLHHDGAPNFTVVVVLLDQYTEMVRTLGRHQVNRLMQALAGRLIAEVRSGDYLARFNDETFALVCASTGESEAINLAMQWRVLLDYTQFENLNTDVMVRAGFGVVRHEPGEGPESLLGLGLMAAKEALLEDGSRVRSVPPRQKPPSSTPRKKLFGF